EHFEALVHGDLRIVRFDLSEIWIDRRVEHERILDHHFRVQSQPALRVNVLKNVLFGSRSSSTRNERKDAYGMNWKLRPGEICDRPSASVSWLRNPCALLVIRG